jgi:hypothetical protein
MPDPRKVRVKKVKKPASNVEKALEILKTDKDLAQGLGQSLKKIEVKAGVTLTKEEQEEFYCLLCRLSRLRVLYLCWHC